MASVTSAAPESRKAIILAGTSDVGGVEIRIGRLFTELYAQNPSVYLITHQSLMNQLNAAGVNLAAYQDRILLLDPRQPSKLGGYFSRKVTYLQWMATAWRLTRKHRIGAVYLAGTGITIGVPLLLDPRTLTVIAYTIPSLGASGITLPNRIALAIELNLATRIEVINRRHDLHRFVLNRGKISLCESSFTDLNKYVPAEPKDQVVVWAGHMEAHKNPLLFVEGVKSAIDRLDKIAPELRFRMLGDGSIMSTVEDRVRASGLEHRIEMTGHVNNVAEHLSKSIIFASTQVETNYASQALLEAMACENAIIVTDVGDTRILNDEGNSILVKTATELGDALVALASDPVHREVLAKAARKTIKDHHTVDAFITHLNTLWVKQ